MARKKSNPVKMPSVEEILNMTPHQIGALTRNNPKLLRKYTSVLRSASLKRLDRLKKSKLSTSQTISYWNNSRFSASMKGVEDKDVSKKFAQYRNFLNMPESTIKGAKSALLRAKEKANFRGTIVEIGEAFSLIDRLSADLPTIWEMGYKYEEVLEDIRIEMESGKWDSKDDLYDGIRGFFMEDMARWGAGETGGPTYFRFRALSDEEREANEELLSARKRQHSGRDSWRTR